MYAHIVVPYDGSKFSERALDAAIEFAKRFGAALSVLSVAPVRPSVGEAAGIPPRAEAQEIEAYRGLAEKAATKARKAGVAKVKAHVREGVIVEQILEFLRSEHADLVVIGSRGQSAIQGLLLGSVPSALVSHAPCPVLVQR